MSVKLVAFKHPLNARAAKILVGAALAGVKVEWECAQTIEDKAAFCLNCHPQGATPVLQTEQGYLFESGAILRHIGRLAKGNGIYGTTDFEASQVDSWIDYATTEVDPNAFPFVGMAFGMVPRDEALIKSKTEALIFALEAVDKWLEIRTFLVGEKLSIGDVALFTTVDTFLRVAETANEFYKLKNMTRWYLTVLHQAKVQEGLKNAGSDAGIPIKPKVEAPKKEEPKKAAAPAAAAAAAGNDEEDDAPTFEEKKKPNPLDALPPSKFVLDAFKREYSNNDTRKVAAPFFFDNFDPEGYTAYWCNYKYNEENKMQFMTANLVRGWFQRMDHVRKYGFGVALIVGEDKKHEITALWIFRGKGIPEIVAEVDDTELFVWTEIADVKAEAAKITDYFAWDGETFATKPVLEGRCFK